MRNGAERLQTPRYGSRQAKVRQRADRRSQAVLANEGGVDRSRARRHQDYAVDFARRQLLDRVVGQGACREHAIDDRLNHAEAVCLQLVPAGSPPECRRPGARRARRPDRARRRCVLPTRPRCRRPSPRSRSRAHALRPRSPCRLQTAGRARAMASAGLALMARSALRLVAISAWALSRSTGSPPSKETLSRGSTVASWPSSSSTPPSLSASGSGLVTRRRIVVSVFMVGPDKPR